MESPRNQVAVVTGSTGGIGAAIARRLTEEGARVVVNSATSVEQGRQLANELADATYVQADVADRDDARRLVSTALDVYGRLDIVVNNAGTTCVVPHADLDAVPDELFRRILDVNLMGAWQVCRAAVPHLQKTEGAIVNITSLAGFRAMGSSIPYALSKAALNHLTVLLANVVGPAVRVNAVAPGLIDTPLTQNWDQARAAVASNAPLQRIGRPEEVADACVFVLRSSYMTGQIVTLDGGLGLR